MHRTFLLLLTILLTACSGASHLAATQSIAQGIDGQIQVPDNLRDVRYCEVLLVKQNRLKLTTEVYNTLGFNNCPDDLWTKLNVDQLAKQYGVKLANLNGPRHWVLNKVTASDAIQTGKVADFGGIKMVQRGTLSTTLLQGSVGNKLYAPNQVQRTTVFTYWAGNRVYELTSPQGEVYMMQSYAQIIDPILSIADLATLGNRLKLPQGWKYQTRVLAKNVELKANGLAYVINDNLYNSYQRRDN